MITFEAKYDTFGIKSKPKGGPVMTVQLDAETAAVDAGHLARIVGKLVTVELDPVIAGDDDPGAVSFAALFERQQVKSQKDDEPAITIVLTLPKDDSIVGSLALLTGKAVTVELEPPHEDLAVTRRRAGQLEFEQERGRGIESMTFSAGGKSVTLDREGAERFMKADKRELARAAVSRSVGLSDDPAVAKQQIESALDARLKEQRRHD